MELPREALFIIRELNAHGYEAFVAGGCVRDFLLGKTPVDFDIATSAEPLQIKALFRRTVDTGIKHGTVTVLSGKRKIEVTTYRIDGVYTDNRRPESVVFTSDLNKDLTRRDFTVNAMAYHPKHGIVDYYGGKADLEKKLIRGVGCPEKRFDEDALRMLRGIRFAAALGFEIEETTKSAIYKKAALIQNISAERIRDEFLKTITAPFPKVLGLLADTKLLFYFSARLQEYLEKNLSQIINNLTKCDKDIISCLTVFFMHGETAFLKSELKNLRLDNRTAKEVTILGEWLKKPLPNEMYGTRKALSFIGADRFRKLLSIKTAITDEDTALSAKMLNSVISNGDCFTLKDLNINGDDLAPLGFSGETIGRSLNELLDYVMRNPEKNKKEALLEKAKMECLRTDSCDNHI